MAGAWPGLARRNNRPVAAIPHHWQPSYAAKPLRLLPSSRLVWRWPLAFVQCSNNLPPFIRFADFVGITKNRLPATVEPHRCLDFLDIAPLALLRQSFAFCGRAYFLGIRSQGRSRQRWMGPPGGAVSLVFQSLPPGIKKFYTSPKWGNDIEPEVSPYHFRTTHISVMGEYVTRTSHRQTDALSSRHGASSCGRSDARTSSLI